MPSQAAHVSDHSRLSLVGMAELDREGNLTMGCGSSRHCMLEERSRLKKRVEANLNMARCTFRNRSFLVIFALREDSLVLRAHGQSLDRTKPEALCGSSQSAPVERVPRIILAKCRESRSRAYVIRTDAYAISKQHIRYCGKMVSLPLHVFGWNTVVIPSQRGSGNNSSQHCRLPRSSDNLIESLWPPISCSKGDAECNSRLR
jgi:hypothetical protein